ncbi:MAG TPA: LCP family protein [Acidimicrobiales bacterium]
MASSGPEGPGLDPPRTPTGRRAASGASSTFDEGGLRALGDEVARANGKHGRHGRRGRSRHRKLWWVLGTVGVLFVVAVGGTAGYAWYLDSQIHRFGVRGLVDVPTTGADAGTENILLVGSTDRCALKVQNAAYGLCSQGVNGVNSDVVMILHLNPNTRKLSILSVPRDLFVPNARAEGANKIDAALYEGPSQLVAAINENLGIPIQHYVVLNFDTFANVVDALGGVKMYFPEPVFDAYSGLQVFTTGCIDLNGVHALQVVRARHLQYKPPGVTTTDPNYWPFENQSDLARIRRDHEFLRVLATAVSTNGLSNPITDGQLISSVAPQLNVDKQFSTSDMVSMVLDFHGVNANSAPQLTLPVQVDQFGSYLYKGGSYGDIEFPSNSQDNQVIDQFLGIDATTDTMTGLPLPAPPTVTVSVLNGSGVTNQATDTSTALGALGFKMVGLGDSTPVGTQAETVVYFAQKTHADQAAAQAVARSMSGAVITALGPTTDGAQVTVVTGSQFTVNPPPAAATTTTAAPTSTTPSSTTTTAPSSGAFQPPTPAVTPLQPWDPRSCTATGGPGH